MTQSEKNTTDIELIAKNTEIKPANIEKVKNHLFYDEHLLDRYVSLGIPAQMQRFDSNLSIVKSWQRLESGNFLEKDTQLLRHETAEAWYMRKNGSGYSAAHNVAQARYPAPNLEEQLNKEYLNRFKY